jgi:hypothetical protein
MGLLTGQVFWDKNGDTVYDVNDVPLSGIQVTLTSLDGSIVKSATTDGGGYYQIDVTAFGGLSAIIRCFMSGEWYIDHGGFVFTVPGPMDGQTQNFPAVKLCRQVASSWIRRICYNPNTSKLIVTFKNGFTCNYDGSLDQYTYWTDTAPSKGKHEHLFFFKKRPYRPGAG